MKTLITLIILIILAILVSPCFGSMVEYDQRDDTQQIQICFEKPINAKTGVFAYSCLTENWQEGYAGLTYSPRPEVQIALGAGRETGGNRVGGWIWAGKGRFSAIYLAEDGASGPWDKTVLKFQATNKLALGWTKKSFAGEGIYAELKLGKNATLKYSGFKTPEVGLKVSF